MVGQVYYIKVLWLLSRLLRQIQDIKVHADSRTKTRVDTLKLLSKVEMVKRRPRFMCRICLHRYLHSIFCVAAAR